MILKTGDALLLGTDLEKSVPSSFRRMTIR